MANVKVRAASVYIGGKKVGTFEGNNYDIASGDEAQFGDPGYLGHSDGAVTTKLSCTGVIPVSGMQVNMIDIMKQKKDVDVTLALVDGKIHQVTMRVVNARGKSSHKNGSQMGDFNLEGGEPQISG